MKELLHEDTVFVSDDQSQEEVFKNIGNQLYERGLVTADFVQNILIREREYPTGLDLTPVNPKLKNIAIPHTESKYVKTTRIVPVKLIHPVKFHNMINPEEVLSVSFLFMILNENGSEQSGLLAEIMDFINATGYQELLELFDSIDGHEIYNLINKNIKETI
ncbi:PTS sugar transporter subunit IIA [Vagococcus sp.]|uniref:PTS sugar transporter subunit IIA n=1 Tax=Vagococcus sp. TaxID=1933889 RepID=UPI003F9AF7A7